MRAAQRAAKQMPKYDRHCFHLPAEERQTLESSGEQYVIRFFTPERTEISWSDVVFGRMQFEQDQVDDFVILKSDGFPTYNFANVVDDHHMKITHVIRAQEFLSSTPKHLLLYEAFGWSAPVIAHVPWVLGTNKQKLSKRHGDVSVDEYKQKGILPQALVNYLVLLGWNPKDDSEIMTMDEIIQRFELEDIQKSGAVFDYDKLLWMNGMYLRALQAADLLELALPYLSEYLIKEKDGTYFNKLANAPIEREKLLKAVDLERERIKSLDEIGEKMTFLLRDTLEYEADLLIWKKGTKEDVAAVLPKVREAFDSLSHWDKHSIRQTLQNVVQEIGKGVGDVFWPTRIALSGQQASPSPEEIAEVLGKNDTLDRLEQAIKKVA